MSRWVPDRPTLSSNSAASEEQETDPSGPPNLDSGSASARSARKAYLIPWWIRVVPFFLSALCFLSAFFSIFAPAPLLILRFRAGWRWFAFAAFTNCAFVAVAGGPSSLALYAIFVLSTVFAIAIVFSRKRSVEMAGLWGLLAIIFSAISVVIVYARIHHVAPWAELKGDVSVLIDSIIHNLAGASGEVNGELKSTLLGGMDLEEFKHKLWVELPAAFGVFSLILVSVNLIILLRINPAGLRFRLGLDSNWLRKWKAPDFLVWPTIIAGFFLLLDRGAVSDVAFNLFKFLMAIYALQGLSILSFFFDVWNIRGVFRALGFAIAVFLMMPLVLSLGFFDLWFDFRSKFRQS